MKKFHKNLYSRQIFTYGIDTMDKIINLKILIIGLRGLGIEIAKNIILTGPKKFLFQIKIFVK
jgi:ubiquitin-activating enzyme E1